RAHDTERRRHPRHDGRQDRPLLARAAAARSGGARGCRGRDRGAARRSRALARHPVPDARRPAGCLRRPRRDGQEHVRRPARGQADPARGVRARLRGVARGRLGLRRPRARRGGRRVASAGARDLGCPHELRGRDPPRARPGGTAHPIRGTAHGTRADALPRRRSGDGAPRMSRQTSLGLYTATARRAAAPVIRNYSTSFGLATRMFPARHRADIGAIYALVRVADEIVDGTAAEAGLDAAAQRRALDEFEADTERAVASGFSANLVVHAFADVARRSGMEPELTRDFFASMRRDLDEVAFDDAEYRRYVHGSAEVVGLMYLREFRTGRTPAPDDAAVLEEGASRLGAAFQKVNFLRDLGHDRAALSRSYLPELREHGLTEASKAAV